MRELLAGQHLIAVVTIEDSRDAVPLAEALVAGGITAIEVTLRTEAAVAGIGDIIRHVPEALIGTGTVCTAQQIDLSVDLGCRYMVSPGFTDDLLNAAQQASIPLLPGVSTVSEVMRGIQFGYRDFKFFPAGACGGVTFIKALQGPFKSVKFCPTGGVDIENMGDYLALGNVLAVGGSWVAPRAMVRAKRWSEIERLARHATSLNTGDIGG